MANKYRVKKGGITIKGRRYVEGSVIHTELDLAAMFKNKVKVLSGPQPERTQREEIVEEDLDEEKKARKAAKAAEADESAEEDADQEAADSDSDDEAEEETPRPKKKKKKKHSSR